MSAKMANEGRCILEEMLEMTNVLISKQDMAKMKLICQSPPQYISE